MAKRLTPELLEATLREAGWQVERHEFLDLHQVLARSDSKWTRSMYACWLGGRLHKSYIRENADNPKRLSLTKIVAAIKEGNDG